MSMVRQWYMKVFGQMRIHIFHYFSKKHCLRSLGEMFEVFLTVFQL